jgi:hypothetical protein
MDIVHIWNGSRVVQKGGSRSRIGKPTLLNRQNLRHWRNRGAKWHQELAQEIRLTPPTQADSDPPAANGILLK